MPPDKLLFIFLDGFGLAPASDHNPMSVFNVWENVIGRPLTTGAAITAPSMVIKGLDATLGVAGIPQSATGQTALFTGVNAAKLCGDHIPAFPPPELQEIIARESLLKKAVENGLTATFANCYREQYFALEKTGQANQSVTTLSVKAAGLPLRTVADYAAGKAICWDITSEHVAASSITAVLPISAAEAGRRLCGLCREFDLVVYESFMPDLIGHKRDWEKARWYCRVLNEFFETVLNGCDSQTTIVVASDHGNFEDFSSGGHTLNPAALCAFGPGSGYFADISGIDQFSHAALRVLQRGRRK
jgi:2,3-bisphosphoglycerate-independent phosphoglycerate mutase